MTWQNRILEHTEEAPDQLLANPKNWRTHPGTQAAALVGVLDSVGYVQSVIANKRTGFLIDGHLRVMEALKRGQPTIPVAWVDLSEEDEALILAMYDPIGAMAGTDRTALEALYHEIDTDNADVSIALSDIAAREGIVPPDVEFKEYDESAADDVKYHECPACGHTWPQ